MFTNNSNQKIISILFILAVLLSNIQTPVVSAQTGDGLKHQRNPESGKVSFIGPESGRATPGYFEHHTRSALRGEAARLANGARPDNGGLCGIDPVGHRGLHPGALPHHRTCGFPHPAVERSGSYAVAARSDGIKNP